MKRNLALVIISYMFLSGCVNMKINNIGRDTAGNEYPAHTGIRAEYDTLILNCQATLHLCSQNVNPYGKDIADSLVLKARSQAMDVKRLAEEAGVLINILDSARIDWANAISGSADDIIFYIDKYLSGNGEAFLDKAEVTASNAWTFCLDALSLPDSDQTSPISSIYKKQ